MAGYSQTPLLKKLGVKPNVAVYFYNAPTTYFRDLGELPEGVIEKKKLTGKLHFIHLFLKDAETFKELFLASRKCMEDDGMLWISWPKKSSKVSTDLDENIIRDFGLAVGLVDVKVCAVDDVWSGLKFVVRLKDRK